MGNLRLLTLIVSPCAASLFLCAPSHAEMISGIVGGNPVVNGAWPWMVSLESAAKSATPYSAHICGASLVGGEWVLTAAHCVDGVEPAKLVVRVGGYDLRSTSTAGQLAKIDRILVHPGYEQATYNHDLALLHLTSSLALETLTPVGYSTMAAMAAGTNLITMGWGSTSTDSAASYPYILQQVTLPYIADNLCSSAYPGAVTENMLCAGLMSGGKDSCYGDSGGPLILGSNSSNAQQVGIISWGDGCAKAGTPGVYTRLANYTDWLNQHQLHLSMDTHTDFGYLPVGHSLVRQIHVLNQGPMPSSLNNLLLDQQQGFSVRANSCANSVLAPGASCAITVALSAQTQGNKEARLTATDTGSSFDLHNRLSATVLPKMSFGNEISNIPLNWYSGGSAGWSDGRLAAGRLPLVAGYGLTDSVSVLQTKIIGPGSLSFEWNVTGGNADTELVNRLDGIEQSSAANNQWGSRSLTIPAGTHLLEWVFTKQVNAPTLAEAKLANLVITGASGDLATDTAPVSDAPTTQVSSNSSGGGCPAWGALLALVGLTWYRRR